MRELLGNSTVPQYVKIMAAGCLSITYLGALGVAFDTYITHGINAQLPTIVSVVIGTGIGISLNILGLHQGLETQQAPNTTSTTVRSNVTTGGGEHASA